MGVSARQARDGAAGAAAGRHASPFSAGVVARASLGGDWRLLLTAGVGILVAIVLICAVPLYGTLMADIQLQSTISAEGPAGRNVEVQLAAAPFTAALRASEDQLVRGAGSAYLSPFAQPGVARYLTADQMLLAQAGARAVDIQATSAPQVALQAFDLAQAQPHMRLLAGALPQAAAGAGGYGALITPQLARDQSVGVGDSLVIDEFGAHDKQVRIVVAGIWQPAQPNDPYWNGRSFTAGAADKANGYSVVLDPDAFVAAVAPITDINVTQHWIYYTNTAKITVANMGDVPANIGLLRARLAGAITSLGANLTIATSLEGDIQNVTQQLTLLALPLYVVVAQVVGLALLFVTAMAGLLVEGQAGYIATLKSRGASGTQLLGSYAAQGLALAVVAALVGPWLAGVLALALIRWFVPAATLTAANTSLSYLAGLTTPQAVILPAIAGALLGVGAIIIATQRAARLDVLALRREQGRALREPLWRRYYLDLGLAVVAILGYVELGSLGTLSVREQVSVGPNSPLLLAAPALLLLAGALLLLRIFPLLAATGAALAARARGATGMLAFSQVGRSSAGPNRLMLLLALSVGLGLFALTFDASLLRNAADRAAYQTGADVRLVQTQVESASGAAALRTRLAALPGVGAVTPVYRVDVTTAAEVGASGVNLLGIEPATWGVVAGGTSWRADYADSSLNILLAGLRAHEWTAGAAASAPGAAGDGAHPLWAVVSQSFAASQHLAVGDRFVLNFAGAANPRVFLLVGGVVRDFPTLYPARQPSGFVVVDAGDALLAAAGPAALPGRTEYWLREAATPGAHAALTRALAANAGALDIAQTLTRRDAEAAIAGNPIHAGIRGLLLVGALIAAGLAVLGTLAQSVLAARQRAVQFAVLRTVGMGARQLARLLLAEQVMIYLFGLIGGTVLGLVMATATLPFLQFGDTSNDPSILGIPAYLLAFDPGAMGWFYLTLGVAAVVALALSQRFAAQVGLGKTLRLGED
ncbi:MAG TPA: FtsX-like permease family protein [Ktedonobacterales bacterium]|nr:FtsX-like permease family protein [Ktedonobacterales bacterium]